MLLYCKKCGLFGINQDDDIKEEPCWVCGATCTPVPPEFMAIIDGVVSKDIMDMNKEEAFQEYVKSLPEFDPHWNEIKNQKVAERRANYEKFEKVSFAIGEAIRTGADPKIALKNGGKNMPKCPTCGSLSVQKISGIERAASVGFWGLFSNKINKSYKCKNCGHTW